MVSVIYQAKIHWFQLLISVGCFFLISDIENGIFSGFGLLLGKTSNLKMSPLALGNLN